MGLYHSTYLCAGVKIPVQKATYEKQIRSCGEHLNTSGDKFCPCCGEPIGEMTVQSEYTLDPEEMLGDDTLFQKINDGFAFLFSNIGKGWIKTPELNTPYSILPADLDKAMNEFNQHHAQDITTLEKITGEKIQVEFFFYHDYS